MARYIDAEPGETIYVRAHNMTEAKIVRGKAGQPDTKKVKDGRPVPPPPPDPEPVPPPTNILRMDFSKMPTSGPAHDRVWALADRTASISMGNKDGTNNNVLLAKAFRFAATGDVKYRDQVIAMLRADGAYSGPNYQSGDEACLQIGRNLAPRVIAASLVGYEDYKTVAKAMRDAPTHPNPSDKTATIVTTHERRGNNFSTCCGSSRIATDIFIEDWVDLERARKIHRGYVGERDQYVGFTFGSTAWQSDPTKPVGINPRGALIQGKDVDGVLPDDQRRWDGTSSGPFVYPFPDPDGNGAGENYVWGAMGDLLLTTLLLGDVLTYGDSALKRAYQWKTRQFFSAVGDDRWQPHMANAMFGAVTIMGTGMQDGKSFGLTDWLYG